MLLYELLTGKTPFDAKELLAAGLDEMRRSIREQEPVRPSTKLLQTRSASSGRLAKIQNPKSKIEADLDWIVMKCLEKDRTRRYETANGLVQDLERHLNCEPVVARPPSTAYRVQKFVRRNKLMVAAASLVALALVVGLGTATVMFFRELAARRGELQQRLAAQSAQRVSETQRQLADAERQRADAQAREASESKQQSRRLLYASDMNLAQQALKANNLGRARRLLERHRPRPGEEDLRGWEWRYLWQLTRSSALVTLTNRPTRGMSVSFSPDGTRLAVGWIDGRVDLWDVPGRRWVRALAHGEHSQQAQVAFSPVRNLLVATSEPKVVTLYDLDSGRESIFWRAPDEGVWDVRDLSFSQDGSRVVIYAESSLGDAAWVVNISSSEIEGRHLTLYSSGDNSFLGAARLAPDNRRLFLARSDFSTNRYSIRCVDLPTGNTLWETEEQRDLGVTALAVSPDGRVLASASGFEDHAIRFWEAETGRLLDRLDGHTGFVGELAFTRDGRRLISAAADQSIRFWDTSSGHASGWAETAVLRGHTDEVHAVAISEAAQLVASTGKDGNLMLWKLDEKSATDGYSRLPEDLNHPHQVGLDALDNSRMLLLPPGRPPELVDVKRDSPPVSVPELGSSTNVLFCFGTRFLCLWNGANQLLVRELRGAEFIQRGTITLNSGLRPKWVAYNPARQLLAWVEGASSTSVYLASLTGTDRPIELKSDVSGHASVWFSEDGNYLASKIWGRNPASLRAWKVATGQVVASIDEGVRDLAFAAGGQVLVVAKNKSNDHEIGFYDLAHADRTPRRVPGKELPVRLAVSPDGRLVALSTEGALVRLFDPVKGQWLEDLHGHMNAAFGIAFSADGRRLISACNGREALKLWDVATRQELLTLGGVGSILSWAEWVADGDVILVGTPWQAWRAPSWAEIEAAERIQPRN